LTGVTDRIEELFIEFYNTSVSHRIKKEKNTKRTKPNKPGEKAAKSFSNIQKTKENSGKMEEEASKN
jgi:hypothetical protein